MKTSDPKTLLAHAQQLASKGAFNELLQTCRRLQTEFPSDTELLLSVAGLLLSSGFLSRAEDLLLSIQESAPGALRVLSALASIHTQRADHLSAKIRYEQATLVSPTDTLPQRGKLLALQYDPATSSEERLRFAKAWGTWATALAGGPRPRPSTRDITGRKLRIGYVSADLCQHTVGLFARGIFAHHQRAEPLVYNAGALDDWVTDQIKQSACVRDVRRFSDVELANQIRDDQIDVLVDLSGHTGGSRLTAFAYRPAPVMVSWLGYFATSGLEYMDGVILDEWHAPDNAQFRFAEPIIRLAQGRLCYDPVPFAPNVKPSPSETNGFVTLGSFNNTAKLNDETIATWADATSSIPNGRLILKWRTFNDPKLCEQTFSKFEAYGLSRDQLELRGPSFHKDLLAEYADIDIALDPFPFTGGLTTCEALWMGVPAVTLPQERTVSRQGLAILSQIGLPELVATDPKNYVEIVTELATNPIRLQDYRQHLRVKMKNSRLCDLASFTTEFEEALYDLYTTINSARGDIKVASCEHHRPTQSNIDNEVNQMRAPNIPSTLLHVGCGPKKKSQTTTGFNSEQWAELRLDIDPAVSPDLIGTMLDMSAVDTGSVDAVFSSHNIEHVYAHEVPLALAEMRRVLTADGFLIITCPDLQSVCELVAEGKLVEAAYQSPAGPIAPIDILYGHRPSLAGGNDYMAHKCGFTAPVLVATIKAAGFISTAAIRRKAPCFDLWVLATCSEVSEEDLKALAVAHFPSA